MLPSVHFSRWRLSPGRDSRQPRPLASDFDTIHNYTIFIYYYFHSRNIQTSRNNSPIPPKPVAMAHKRGSDVPYSTRIRGDSSKNASLQVLSWIMSAHSKSSLVFTRHERSSYKTHSATCPTPGKDFPVFAGTELGSIPDSGVRMLH